MIVDSDPMTWPLAEFPKAEKDRFSHYSDPGDPGCFVGNSRLFRVKPLIVRPRYVVAPASVKVPGLVGDRICPWAHLLMPRGRHIVDRRDLPDDWTAQQNNAHDELEKLGFTVANVSVNLREEGGRTMIAGEPLHWHEWLWSRPDSESGLLSSGVGPVTMLTRILRYGITMSA